MLDQSAWRGREHGQVVSGQVVASSSEIVRRQIGDVVFAKELARPHRAEELAQSFCELGGALEVRLDHAREKLAGSRPMSSEKRQKSRRMRKWRLARGHSGERALGKV